MPSPSVAFVTVSHAADRDRCALLCRSLDALVPSYEHVIVVDRADEKQFRALGNTRTSVLVTEEVLPVWMRRVNLRRFGVRSNAWVQLRAKPVRGWLLQQLVKLAVPPVLDAEVVVHADSDVALVRPFEPGSLVREGGRVRLYAKPDGVAGGYRNEVLWHRAAERLLGLEATPLPLPDFVTSLVPWKRANATALLEHVQATTGRNWVRALANAWHVSEYTLYGRFVTDVLGDRAGQFVTSASLCKDYWLPVALSAEEVEAFLVELEPEVVSLSLTAKAGMATSSYEHVLERRWALERERLSPARVSDGPQRRS
jgi:hypothetical protein